jgi:hypothetical protein
LRANLNCAPGNVNFCGITGSGLLETEGNTTLGQVIRRHFDADAVTSKNTNAVLAHLARGMSKNFVIIVQKFDNSALKLDNVFFSHETPSFRIAIPITGGPQTAPNAQKGQALSRKGQSGPALHFNHALRDGINPHREIMLFPMTDPLYGSKAPIKDPEHDRQSSPSRQPAPNPARNRTGC